MRALRDKYLGAEPAFTKLVVLDTDIAMMLATAHLMERKALKLKGAMSLLAMAVLLIAVGIPLH